MDNMSLINNVSINRHTLSVLIDDGLRMEEFSVWFEMQVKDIVKGLYHKSCLFIWLGLQIKVGDALYGLNPVTIQTAD